MTKHIPKGGEFLISDLSPSDIFIREEFTEEQKMMYQATVDFINTEVVPNISRFEHHEYKLTESLIRKAGELGLLSIGLSEEYGGLNMGFNTTMLICEEMSGQTGSLATAFGAHTGIGTLPIQLYGSESTKKKFLPKIGSGEWISCYNLTEPDAGSDANSGKTKAVLTPDGKHYEITGQKIWISNAGMADVFIVFARIEDDKNISSFVFHKDEVTGLTLNEEEKKMGLHSSSTRQVFYDKVKIPVEQMLGERGDGFKIAVNALNAGRIKLAVATSGAMQNIISWSVKYANERKQFGKTIGEFGAIKQKLGNMATLAYCTDTAVYRAGQNIEDNTHKLAEEGYSSSESKLMGIKEYAIECALLKVYASEAVRFVSDEGVQIYGGMGFSAETPMEAAYRDARISRIYEGTNEINKMLAVNQMLKKAMAGKLDMMSGAKSVMSELMDIPDFSESDTNEILADETKILKNLKNLLLLLSGASVQKLGLNLSTEQELLMHLADLGIEIYVLESAICKTKKMAELKIKEDISPYIAMTTINAYRAVEICVNASKEIVYSVLEGDEQQMLLLGIKRFTKTKPKNLTLLRREVANVLLKENQWCL